jgi:hypothetical protein
MDMHFLRMVDGGVCRAFHALTRADEGAAGRFSISRRILSIDVREMRCGGAMRATYQVPAETNITKVTRATTHTRRREADDPVDREHAAAFAPYVGENG